jgi:SAM-dependent methyltransferase
VTLPEVDPWEAAYLRFQTPAQEIRKFRLRLLRLGARRWPRDARVVELFCGRGNGLRALERLGFTRLEGVDRSPALVARYDGPAVLHVADCRTLPFEDASRDIAIVQGGLHHLEKLPGDLERTLDELCRVLRPGGLVAAVEPWLTPFLRLVHWACRQPALARAVPKLDAFHTMTRYELDTYVRWLGAPDAILAAFERRFETRKRAIGWGKLMYLGQKPGAPS